MPQTRDIRDRFMDKVNKTDTCWLWLGCKHISGYGRFTVSRRVGCKPAHRVSYSLFVGEILSGLLVCHHCDVPACVRPDHLFVGTDKDNSTDRDNKGRTFGKNNPLIVFGGEAGRLRGSAKKGGAKLNQEIVTTIRLELQSGASKRSTAKKYAVSRAAIQAIASNKTWAQHAGK